MCGAVGTVVNILAVAVSRKLKVACATASTSGE
jgi:hypothetical protein